jgi:hypothetical protein
MTEEQTKDSVEELLEAFETKCSTTEPPSTLSLYDETISEILRVSKDIHIKRETGDGRIQSAIKEPVFLNELKTKLLEEHSSWNVIISPPRASCDIMINDIRINLKLTDCKSSDNSVNKPSIYYSITGIKTYPYSSTWNDFIEKLEDAKKNDNIKKKRHKSTEYHYLVKNKINDNVLLKPIFDIHTYISNPSNDLQINWKNEFAHIDYTTPDDTYLKKVEELLCCIQESVKSMIERTRKFAEADIHSIFSTEE